MLSIFKRSKSAKNITRKIFIFFLISLFLFSGFFENLLDKESLIIDASPEVPIAETEEAINIWPTSARIRGKITDDGGEVCDTRFRWRKTGTRYEHYTTYNSLAVASLYELGRDAQTFTPSVSHVVTMVRLLIRTVGAPPALVIEIRTVDEDGIPTDTILCSGEVAEQDVFGEQEGNFNWTEIFLGAGAQLTSGTQYAIVARVKNDGGDTSNYWRWRLDSNGAYTGGQYCWVPTEGGSWDMSLTGYDLRFEVYDAVAWTTLAWDETGYNTNDTFYKDLTGLDPETEYEFQTQARNTAGEGNWSSSKTFETLAEATVILGKGKDAYQLEINGTEIVNYINSSSTVSGHVGKGWNHVSLTYDKNSEEVKLYINGAEADSAIYSESISTNNNSLKIGDYFSGKIDETKIYNRALSAGEVSQNYDSSRRVIIDTTDEERKTIIIPASLNE